MLQTLSPRPALAACAVMTACLTCWCNSALGQQHPEPPRAHAVQPAAIEPAPAAPSLPVAPADPAEPRPQPERMRDLAKRLAAEPSPPRAASVDPARTSEAKPLDAAATGSLLQAPVVSEREKLPLGQRDATVDGADAGDERAAKPVLDSGWVLNTVSALGVVVGLLLLLRVLVPKLTGRPSARSSGAVELLSRVALAPRSHVLLVRVGQRVLVLGDGPGGLRTLADIDEPEQVAALLATVSAERSASISQNFTQMMQAFNGQYRPGDDAEGSDEAEADIDRARDRVGLLLNRVRSLAKGGGS